MNQIKCPNCDTIFPVDESDYHKLIHQVRTAEFDRELESRLEQLSQMLDEKAKNQMQIFSSQKEKEVAQLHHQIETLSGQLTAEKEQALLQKDHQIQHLSNELEKLQLIKDSELQQQVSAIERERDGLRLELELAAQKQELALTTAKQAFDLQLKAANEQVAFYRDFKAQQSTKAIGESLEAYAEAEFNKVRSYAFPRATFHKDNLVSSRGSKGDFIFREVDETGIELLSIMFEMKNEADGTKTKHKNTDFLKELDKDRREKNCEYAVLVTMLEADSDYYNTGIVDVSHLYDKMYVVRPQFFIHLIGLLRNAALNSLKYKQELALVKSQQLDITHFEEDLEAFKTAFAKNYTSASQNFKKAIDEIDKAIKRMEEIKRFLTTSENQLRLANNKLDDVSVKKLTRKNPTMRAKFEALKTEDAEEGEL